MKKHILKRIPIDVNDEFKIKQQKMSKIYTEITGKKKKIPLTRVMKVMAAQPLYLNDKELVKLFGKRRKIN